MPGILNAVIAAAATIYASRGINKSSSRILRKERASKILGHLAENVMPLTGAPLFFGALLCIGIKLVWGEGIAKAIGGYLLVMYSALGIFIICFYLYFILILDVDREESEETNE